MEKENSIFSNVSFTTTQTSSDRISVVINGISIPRMNDFDPLFTLWTEVRKFNLDKLGSDVAGTFTYVPSQDSVVCNFYLNMATIEDEHIRKVGRRYEFARGAALQAAIFQEVFWKWLFAEENGFHDYLDFTNKVCRSTKKDAKTANDMFKAFLSDIGICKKRKPKEAVENPTKTKSE